MEQTTTISQGTELLFTLFFWQPKKLGKGEECFDFFTYFFWRWTCKEKDIPNDQDLKWIYGEFLWKDKLVEVLETDYFDAWPEDFNVDVREYRLKALKKIIEELDPFYWSDSLEDFFTYDDISQFLQLCARNRVRWDAVIKKNEVIVKELASRTSTKAYDMDREQVENITQVEDDWAGIDWTNKEIYYTEAFERLEKANWKRFVEPKYHDFVDQLNLTELKKIMKDTVGNSFCPLGWQWEFLLKHNRFNFIAWSRRIGKTFLGAGYLSWRQIMLPDQNVIYVVPTLKNHAAPAWKDLEVYFRDFSEIKMDKNNYVVTNTRTNSTIRFVTAERKDAVRWAAANLLICDEMAFVNEQVFESASALVATTNGMVYGISTVNPDVPKNHFYYSLLQAEIEMMSEDSEYYGRRVTLDQNPFIPEKEKERIRSKAKNIDFFNAEWMCVFMDKDSFNLQNFWIMDEKPVELLIDGRWKTYWRADALERTMKSYYTKYIISHDGAKRKDKPGITVYGIRNGEMQTVMAAYAEGFEYYDQVDLICDIAKMLWWIDKVDIVIDYGGAGIAVEEIFRKKRNINPICIQTVGESFEWKDWFVWRVGKEMMKNKLRAGLDLGNLKWFSFMNQLRMEFEAFSDEAENKRMNWNHFDLIKSMFQAYRWAEKSWYLEKETVNQAKERLEWDFDWMDNDSIFHEGDGDPYERIWKFGY